MKSTSHRLSGVALGGAIFVGLPTGTGPEAILAALAAYAGSTAPDRLEIPRWKEEGFWPWSRRKVRHSAIPHRSLTHWVLPWLLLAGAGVWQGWPILWALALGGLLHCLLDGMTPMGVPVIDPRKRLSLNLVRGGFSELVGLAGVSVVIGLGGYASSLALA